MAARVVEVAGRQWVAGLDWSSFEDIPTKEELRGDANRLFPSEDESDVAWCALRVGETAIQGGFCRPVEGIKSPRKLYSLAAMLADSREQPWLGIFNLGNGLWWYVAVRDHHAILPDGDVIGGQEEILAVREHHSGYADWNYIEGDLDVLANVIGEIDARPTPLRSLSEKRNWKLPLVGTALALSLAVGGAYWWKEKKAQEERERVEAMERMRAQLAANKKPQALPLPPSPLLTTPSADKVLSGCGSAVRSLPLSTYGWSLESFSCSVSAATVVWFRDVGATVILRPEGDLASSGDRITQSIPLGLELHGEDDSIPLKEAELAMRAWAQTANIAADITRPVPVPKLPGVADEQMPPPAPQMQVILNLSIPPFSLDFSRIPGFRINQVKSKETGWEIQGVLYGSR